MTQFAGMYVLGNMIALCATGFLVGPKNQCKKMFDQTRRYSCIFYLVMLVVVFVVAMTVRTPTAQSILQGMPVIVS